MEKLLKWSLDAANADGSTPVKGPDPAILQQLFGGKDEAALMRESMFNALNPTLSKEQRLTSFDDLEMLVESLDNANNLGPLGLWNPLIDLLDNEDKDFARMSAWIIGTATQNNEKSQEQALEAGKEKGEVIAKLIKVAQVSTKSGDKADDELSIKGLYALSSITGHNLKAYNFFRELNGWDIFPEILSTSSGSSDKLRQRALGFLRVLATAEPVDVNDRHQHVAESKLVPTVIHDRHIGVDANSNTRDRALGLLQALKDSDYKFSEEERKDIQKVIEDLKKDGILEKDEYSDF